MERPKVIEIKGVWLLKGTISEGVGPEIRVLVELPDGTYREIITEFVDDGPISHYVHAAGIANAHATKM